MQANFNKQRTPTTFDLPSADVDFLAALQKFIEKDAERRSRIVRDWLSIRIDGVHQRVIDSESWCPLEFEGGTSKVEIVGRDAEGEVVIATYLPTYDGPKTEAWKVSLPWGDELSCTFEYDEDECVRVEAKRIVKPKLGDDITRFYGGASTNKDQDALGLKFSALVHRARNKFRSLHALNKPEERQGLDEESTQGRGQGPSHSSRDKI